MDEEGAHAMQSVGEYLEPGYAPNPEQAYVDDATYAKILDAVVFACVDIALTRRGQMLLGKRTRDPQPDWWVMGGRMKAGETFALAGTRLLQKEANLSVDPQRFLQLTMFAAAWNQRALPPISNGSHSLSVVLTVEISDEEAEKVRLNDEYSDSGWADFATVANNGAYHPALRQIGQALVEKGKVNG